MRVVLAVDSLSVNRARNAEVKAEFVAAVGKIAAKTPESVTAERTADLRVKPRLRLRRLKINRAADGVCPVERRSGPAQNLDARNARQSKIRQKGGSVAGNRGSVAKTNAVNQYGSVLIS